LVTFLIKLKLSKSDKNRINQYIRARELRVIGPQGENYGVLTLEIALQKSKEAGLDLIEISPNSNPPVAKIADYGKFLYEQNKKQKIAKSKSHIVEIKNIQIKVGTDENDLNIKAKKASEWLKEGHRVKIELFLPGRTKYLEKDFLESRLNRILKLIAIDYKIAEPQKRNPKGLAMIIEKQ
jgi:translation initiation factor IF-3